MPTGEDILRHAESCEDCQAEGQCSIGEDLLRRHLDEVDEGIKRQLAKQAKSHFKGCGCRDTMEGE